MVMSFYINEGGEAAASIHDRIVDRAYNAHVFWTSFLPHLHESFQDWIKLLILHYVRKFWLGG